MMGLWMMFLATAVLAAERPGPSPASAPTSEPSTQPAVAGQILYRGKPRSQAWLNATFAELGSNVFELDGRCADLGREVLDKPVVWAAAPPVGSTRWVTAGARDAWDAKILQALPGGSALVEFPIGMGERVTIHVDGLPAGLVDGAQFPGGPLVYKGPHVYRNALGARQTVQGFRTIAPVTKERFTKALASGLELSRFRKKTTKVRYPTGTIHGTTSYAYRSEMEIVATPVP